jgi:type VI secretion system secreted protein Hcp
MKTEKFKKKNVPGVAFIFFTLLLSLLIFPGLTFSQDYEGGNSSAIYVRIEGITGPSLEINHQNWIEAYSFSMGVTDPGAQVGGTTAGRTRPVLKPVTIVKPFDRASPQIALDAATGIHIPNVCIEVTTPTGNDSVSPIKVGLQDVQIASVDSTVAEGQYSRLKEVVTLSYKKIFWQYSLMKADGSPDATIITGWDAVRNVSIIAASIPPCR